MKSTASKMQSIGNHLRWLLTNSETLEFRADMPAEKVLENLRAKVAKPAEFLTSRMDKPLKGKVGDQTFNLTLRTPWFQDYNATYIEGAVTPIDGNSCSVKVACRNSYVLMPMTVTFLIGSIVLLVLVIIKGTTPTGYFIVSLFVPFLVYGFYDFRRHLRKVFETTVEILEEVCTTRSSSHESGNS